MKAWINSPKKISNVLDDVASIKTKTISCLPKKLCGTLHARKRCVSGGTQNSKFTLTWTMSFMILTKS